MGAIPDHGIVSRNSADWITDMLQILNERFGIERQVKKPDRLCQSWGCDLSTRVRAKSRAMILLISKSFS